MRSVLLLSVVAAFVLGVSVIPAGAGQEPFQTLDIVKVIEGPAPPGAQFVVHVECLDIDDMVLVDEDLTFTTEETQLVDLLGGSITCTVTETETAGATVTYACESLSASTCTSDSSIENLSDVASSVITVTNTFPEPPVAEPVVVGPTFTG